MSDFLQNVMTFINEYTYILIGICVFLIFVLIGYLIDNSVKAKKAKNEIKGNKHVPLSNDENNIGINNNVDTKLNINEPIKEETDLNKMQDAGNDINDINVFETNGANTVLNENIAPLDSELKEEIDNSTLLIDEKENLNAQEIMINNNENEIRDVTKETSPQLNSLDSTVLDNFIIDDNITKKETSDNGYSNNKKLSEILKESSNIDNNVYNNIFNDDLSDIKVNTNVSKEKVEIESNSQDDELDKIMKKLSSMNRNEEDRYTNIF